MAIVTANSSAITVAGVLPIFVPKFKSSRTIGDFLASFKTIFSETSAGKWESFHEKVNLNKLGERHYLIAAMRCYGIPLFGIGKAEVQGSGSPASRAWTCSQKSRNWRGL